MAVLGTQVKFSLQGVLANSQGILAKAGSSSRCAFPSFSGLRGDGNARVKVNTNVFGGQCASKGCVVMPVASLEDDEEGVVSRRSVLAATSAGLALSRLSGDGGAALADDTISSWEQVMLPVDPGVVLLDMAFVPDQPDRGMSHKASLFDSNPSIH